MPQQSQETICQKLASYLAYKLRACVGDQALVVTAGRTVRGEDNLLRTAYTVRFGREMYPPPERLVNLLHVDLPPHFSLGAMSADIRPDETVIYLKGDPAVLLRELEKSDKAALRAANAKAKPGGARGV